MGRTHYLLSHHKATQQMIKQIKNHRKVLLQWISQLGVKDVTIIEVLIRFFFFHKIIPIACRHYYVFYFFKYAGKFVIVQIVAIQVHIYKDWFIDGYEDSTHPPIRTFRLQQYFMLIGENIFSAKRIVHSVFITKLFLSYTYKTIKPIKTFFVQIQLQVKVSDQTRRLFYFLVSKTKRIIA